MLTEKHPDIDKKYYQEHPEELFWLIYHLYLKK
jgi:hypothetical protein